MQTIVIYSSQTGNTRKLATQIFAAIPGDSKDLKNIDEYREKDAAANEDPESNPIVVLHPCSAYFPVCCSGIINRLHNPGGKYRCVNMRRQLFPGTDTTDKRIDFRFKHISGLYFRYIFD